MPRFAILAHDHPFLHWDLLLENGDTCRTWRLLTDPDLTTSEILAHEMFDHRLMYLDYEGPVSRNRGSVIRWDYGTFEWRRQSSDVLEVQIDGTRWQGIVRLTRFDKKDWRCTRVKLNDENE